MKEEFLKKARYGLAVGLILLILGMVLFIVFESGEKIEKIGVFLMTFGGVMIGMGYTAYVAGKTTT